MDSAELQWNPGVRRTAPEKYNPFPFTPSILTPWASGPPRFCFADGEPVELFVNVGTNRSRVQSDLAREWSRT